MTNHQVNSPAENSGNFWKRQPMFLKFLSLSVTWRDITLCQGIPGCPVLLGTTGYYQVLPGTIWYNPQ
eukprot:405350-Amorphochlora_amoeboformis.AAC.1